MVNKYIDTNTSLFTLLHKNCNVYGIATMKLNQKSKKKIKSLPGIAIFCFFSQHNFVNLFSSGYIFLNVICGNGTHGEVIGTYIAQLGLRRGWAKSQKQFAHVGQANAGDVFQLVPMLMAMFILYWRSGRRCI